MGKRDKKRKFSDTWATQTQLGNMFNLSAKEIGQKLNELELRTYSIERHKHIPTQLAINNGFCTSTPLKYGVPFYMWHRAKTSLLLQEKLHLVPLSDTDIEYRETALYPLLTNSQMAFVKYAKNIPYRKHKSISIVSRPLKQYKLVNCTPSTVELFTSLYPCSIATYKL